MALRALRLEVCLNLLDAVRVVLGPQGVASLTKLVGEALPGDGLVRSGAESLSPGLQVEESVSTLWRKRKEDSQRALTSLVNGLKSDFASLAFASALFPQAFASCLSSWPSCFASLFRLDAHPDTLFSTSLASFATEFPTCDAP